MNEFRVTGKTVDDAVTEACIQLGVTSDQIEYEVIEKGSKGLLGFGAKLAVIEVRRKAVKPVQKEEKPERAEKPEKPAVENRRYEKKEYSRKPADKKPRAEKKQPENKKANVQGEKTEVFAADAAKAAKPVKAEKNVAPVEEVKAAVTVETAAAEKNVETPAKEIKPMDCEKVQAGVDTFLQDLFKAMHMDVEIKYQCDATSRTIGIELVGSEMGVLIGKRGQTLDSLQYLISLVANKESGDYVRVKLDTENYRRRRRVTLENLARNIAYKVKRERKPVTLEPMNPYERRIIHSTLQNDRYVETHSEGAEPYRRVVITLKKNNNNA